MTRALVIGRRRPGRKIGAAVRETTGRLEAAGWKVEGVVVRRKSALRSHAADAVEAGVDVVVAVGGDGAVLQVVNSLAETKVALGIIPMGTGNLLAGNLGIPHPLDQAVKVLVEGHHRRIDLGRVEVGGKEHYFSVACGVGFDARVMEKTATSDKRRIGKLAYVVAAMRQAQHVRDVTHRITLDGEPSTRKAIQVFVANFGQIGSLIQPRREIQPDDGLLDLIVIRASGPLRGLLAGGEALLQRDLGSTGAGNVFRAQAKDVRVEARHRRLVETDGSVIGTTPIVVSIRPHALTVIEPAP
jgi:YegS/Rv2252/BmrU family lipid kinase